MRPLKIGLFGIGLDTYWPQFEGLKQRLEGYLDVVQARLKRPDVEVVNLGLIDNPSESAGSGASHFDRADVDLIFLYVTTYALSSTVLPVVQRAKVPVIILNLQPTPAIDYASFNKMGDRTKMTGEWLAHCAACPVPEIANVFNRAEIEFHQVTGMLHDDPECWNEVDAWIDAARVAHVMFHNRLGLMGHYYCGMLDIYTDLTQQCAVFGGHMELIEVDELASLRTEVSDAQIKERVAQFREKIRRAIGLLGRRTRPRGAHERGAGSAWSRITIWVAGLLLHGHGKPRQRRCDQLDHPGQFAADRARNSRRRRIRSEERPGDEDHGHLRRRRIVHRILRDGFQRRRRTDGPRRPGAYRDRAGQNQSSPAECLSRKSRQRDCRWRCR